MVEAVEVCGFQSPSRQYAQCHRWIPRRGGDVDLPDGVLVVILLLECRKAGHLHPVQVVDGVRATEHMVPQHRGPELRQVHHALYAGGVVVQVGHLYVAWLAECVAVEGNLDLAPARVARDVVAHFGPV